MQTQKRQVFKEIIENDVYVDGNTKKIADGEFSSKWLFDFRNVMLRPHVLNLYAEYFFEEYKDELPFQVGGLEVASIPLISAIVMKSVERGTPVNGFFIRKSRKKTGLLKMIEGTIRDEKIILVDDLINSGSSFIRQVEVLTRLKQEDARFTHLNVYSIFAVLRFRDLPFYSYFSDRGIKINSIFELNDLSNSLPVQNLVKKTEAPIQNKLTPLWHWKGLKPNYEHVLSKSAPLFHSGRLYFGTDTGSFVCLNADTGTESWKVSLLGRSSRETQYSTALICDRLVIFGCSDGNVHAFDTQTGARAWTCFDADWVSSSPSYSPKHETIYITLEYGFLKKKSFLVAINALTGEVRWKCSLGKATRSSPAYSKIHDRVYCGSGDGTMNAVDAATGKIVWRLPTPLQIVSAPLVDETHGVLIFGGLLQATDENDESVVAPVYTVDLKNGTIQSTYSGMIFGTFGTPVVHKDLVLITSLDKHIHAFEVTTGAFRWKHNTKSRIFSTPVIIDDSTSTLYVGANNGVLYEIKPESGTITSMTYVTERITSQIAYDPMSRTVFLPTYANEVYALKRPEPIL